MDVTRQLRAFARQRRMVRFRHRFAQYSTKGYIAGVGADLCLVTMIDDRIRWDGFLVCRNRDLRDLREEPYATFVATALRRRGARRPAKPRVELANFARVLRSAGRSFPLVTIHRERVDAEICQIGAVVAVDARQVVLHEIRPGARWQTSLDTYPLREITRIEFGGSYEDALHVVGGNPPRRREQTT
jgi:hypothetical protein